jgi:DeoR/GlpR family transcriptional regulator of sugar metabolism
MRQSFHDGGMLRSPVRTCRILARAQPLTIVTNVLNIASEMAMRQHVKIVFTGVARGHSFELIGALPR